MKPKFSKADLQLMGVGRHLTQAQREQAQKDERNQDFVDKKVRATGSKGPTTAPKLIAKGTELMPTYDQLNDGTQKGSVTSDFEPEDGRPVIPVAIEVNPHGGFDYILTPYDYEMVRQGNVCPKCLEWQVDTWTTHCTWRTRVDQPDRGLVKGCGNERNLAIDLNYKKGK